MAARYDLRLEEGATYRRTFARIDDADGTPIPLTGYTARLEIRKARGDTTDAAALALTSTPAAGLTVDTAGGLVTVTITDEQTDALPGSLDGRRGVYDVLLTHSDGSRLRLVEGDVILSPRVTSAAT